ncbi:MULTISPECIES: hypothetical protein [Rhodococcus]|uniref:hypothetical protein n=1 Tax=Rhodococcus TaxID=1827 RepID=UPI001A6420AC|nr:hypothetical protein [Rhodococcus qingshengii]MCQ4152592.1 hypothetical protein [Rhodococcus qingshengii]ULD45097.1 hypothetical protein JKI97_32210 [Rhodococcus qingshengii]
MFTVISIDEDTQTAIIESTADAPGKYPFPMKTTTLVSLPGFHCLTAQYRDRHLAAPLSLRVF